MFIYYLFSVFHLKKKCNAYYLAQIQYYKLRGTFRFINDYGAALRISQSTEDGCVGVPL